MEKVRANGADLVLNHNEEGYLDKIDGVDLVIEMLANVNLEKDLEVLNNRGRVMIIGNRGSLDFNPRLTMAKEADIRGIAIWNATQAERAESLDAIEEYLAKNSLKPEIGPIYPLEKASQAQHDIIHEVSKGKILLKCH
jgi:NADPH2:quinone reductase